MERLTKFSGGIWSYKDQCGKAITLLAEYENTGLNKIINKYLFDLN